MFGINFTTFAGLFAKPQQEVPPPVYETSYENSIVPGDMIAANGSRWLVIEVGTFNISPEYAKHFNLTEFYVAKPVFYGRRGVAYLNASESIIPADSVTQVYKS